MSALRTTALAALEAHTRAQTAKAAEMKRQEAEDALARIANSPLGDWFPDVKWEFVGNCGDGTTLVREKDGIDLVLGAVIVKNGHQDTWQVAVYQPLLPSSLAPGQWRKVVDAIKSPAELGAYIDRTEPKPA